MTKPNISWEESVKWSYSSLKKFMTCPKQYYHTKVTKEVVEPETTATRYGTALHLAAEEYVRDGTPLPPVFEFMQGALDSLKKLPGDFYCEYKMGLTRGLEPCDFSADDRWWCGIADLLIINGEEARIVDYKTSKSAKYADTGQLDLMAMAVFKHFPQVKVVKGGLLFVIAKAFPKANYKAEDQTRLWIKWFTEYNRMQAAHESGVFNPRPSGLCKEYCAVVQCPHNGRV